MSGAALGVDRAAARQGRVWAVLRGPVPVWAALFLNVQAFLGLPTVVPIPGIIGQMITQGALVVAVGLAIMANPGGVIRPSLFLALLTMLAVVALMVSIHNEFMLGSTFRACRFIAFVLVLWLLTPWWGEIRPRSAACSPHVPSHHAPLSSRRRLTRPRRCVLVRRSFVGRAVAYPPDAGSPLRGRPVRVHGGAVVRWGDTRTSRLVDGSRSRRGSSGHTHADRPAEPDYRSGCGRRQHVCGSCQSPAYIALVCIFAVIAATFFAPLILNWLWRGQTVEEARATHGTHQGMVRDPRASTALAPGALRIRAVQ